MEVIMEGVRAAAAPILHEKRVSEQLNSAHHCQDYVNTLTMPLIIQRTLASWPLSSEYHVGDFGEGMLRRAHQQ